MDKMTEKARAALMRYGLTEHQAGLVADACLRVLRREKHLELLAARRVIEIARNVRNHNHLGLYSALVEYDMARSAERKARGGEQ